MGAYAIRANWFDWAGGAPAAAGAGVSGVTVALQFSEAMKKTPNPTAAQFTFEWMPVSTWVAIVVSAAAFVDSDTLGLTLATPVTAGKACRVSYVSNGPVKLMDADSHLTPNFTNKAVTNVTP